MRRNHHDDDHVVPEAHVARNIVKDNPYDCGLTLASHHFDTQTLDPAYGVYHNTVTGNTSSGNGTKTGEGAGVGLFAGPPGAQTYGNVVVDNILVHNGLPGVAMHSHVFNQNLNGNSIVGNRIADDGPDGDPGTIVPAGIAIFSDDTGGAAPIMDTVIAQNVFGQEGIDVAVKTPGSVDAHLNSFLDAVGVSNLGSGPVYATENWWGCSRGPGSPGCATVAGTNVRTDPWLERPSMPMLATH